MLLAVSFAFAMDCAVPAPGEALDIALEGAESAWGVDAEAFTAGAASAASVLPCVAEPLTPARAARVHRVRGLSAFLARDLPAAREAFAAARAADPAYVFPDAMVPEGNPVRVAYDTATAPSLSRAVPPPAGGAGTWFDGVPAPARPVDRPTVFQLVDDGAAQATAWLAPGAPLPAYPERGAGLRTPLLAGAGAAAAGAVVLYALAVDARADYLASREESEAVAEAGRARANAFAGGATAAGVGAAVAGTCAFVVGRW